MRIKEPFTSDVDSILRDIQELKSTQYIGKGSIITYKTNSDDDYDLTFFSDQLQDKYILTFTHATAPRTILDLAVFTSIDQPDVMSDPILYTGTAPPIITRYKKIAPPDIGVTRWQIVYVNSSWGITDNTYNVYSKFFFNGTDTGTWELVPV